MGTSMISNVKGETEISLDLPDWWTPGGYLLQSAATTISFSSSFLVRVNEITRPDIHLLYPRSDKVSSTPYLWWPLQKIEFGSTRQPWNSSMLHVFYSSTCRVPISARTGGKIFISANLCFSQLLTSAYLHSPRKLEVCLFFVNGQHVGNKPSRYGKRRPIPISFL